MTETETLSRFIAELGPPQIPEDVQRQAKRCLIDHLGVALAGFADPAAAIVVATVDELDGRREATVLGAGLKTGVAFAAFANGFLAHVSDFDDTYNPERTTVHGSAPVWPVVLALGERGRIDGGSALAAFVAGFETEIHVALAAGPAHYDAGWHVTGTVGHFGAAAAAANALRLPAAAVVNALGTAGTQAAGVKEVYGSMGKALHPGKAALDGLLAALLAARGFTSSPSVLEGERGFLRLFSPAAEPERLTAGLGERWTLLENGFKPYACGSLTHPTVEAVIVLRERYGFAPEDVERVEARVHGYVRSVTGKERPATGLEGKFSIFHSAAVALLHGKAGPAQFSDEVVNDPRVVALRERVAIVVDDALPKQAASVRVVLRDGRAWTHSVAHNKGTPTSPMSDAEIDAKFLELATPRLGAAAAQAVLADCRRLETLDDVGRVARACAGATR